jgi:hypothetical protein
MASAKKAIIQRRQKEEKTFERDVQTKRPDCNFHCNYRNDKGNSSSYQAKKRIHEHVIDSETSSTGRMGKPVSHSHAIITSMQSNIYGERSLNNIKFSCHSSPSYLSTGPTWGYSIIHLRFAHPLSPSPFAEKGWDWSFSVK